MMNDLFPILLDRYEHSVMESIKEILPKQHDKWLHFYINNLIQKFVLTWLENLDDNSLVVLCVDSLIDFWVFTTSNLLNNFIMILWPIKNKTKVHTLCSTHSSKRSFSPIQHNYPNHLLTGIWPQNFHSLNSLPQYETSVDIHQRSTLVRSSLIYSYRYWLVSFTLYKNRVGLDPFLINWI